MSVCLAAGREHVHSGLSPSIRGQAAQARPTKRRCSTWRNPATTGPGGATKTPSHTLAMKVETERAAQPH